DSPLAFRHLRQQFALIPAGQFEKKIIGLVARQGLELLQAIFGIEVLPGFEESRGWGGRGFDHGFSTIVAALVLGVGTKAYSTVNATTASPSLLPSTFPWPPAATTM